MREIRFRAWDEKEKKMYPVLDITWPYRLKEKEYPLTVLLWKPETDQVLDLVPTNSSKIELMQYTGLKDKNGKEIFEADIVAQKKEEGGYWWKDKVFFDKGAFMLDDNQTLEFILDDFDYEVEVIGNIYENPELLK